jgi:hypothetical protein
MELVDAVCKNFEDYAQAKTKTSGEPVIIRSGLQAFRFWIRFRIWIRIQHKLEYKSHISSGKPVIIRSVLLPVNTVPGTVNLRLNGLGSSVVDCGLEPGPKVSPTFTLAEPEPLCIPVLDLVPDPDPT